MTESSDEKSFTRVKETWNEKRSFVRLKSTLSDNLRKSLQVCPPDANKSKLKYLLDKFKHTSAKVNTIKGLIAVLEELLMVTENDKSSGCLSFADAYEIYSSYCAHDPDKQGFRDLLLDETYGLSVYIYTLPHNKEQLVILQSIDTDVEYFLHLFQEKLREEKEVDDRLVLDYTSVNSILKTVSTEYDRQVVKSVLAANRSRRQVYEMGMKPDRMVKAVQHIQNVVKQMEDANIAAAEIVSLRLADRKEKITKQIQEASRYIDRKGSMLTDMRLIDEEERRNVLQERLKETESKINPINKVDKEKVRRAIKRTADRLIDENRVKMRKLGAGQPQLIDSDDENFLAKAIESKSTAHGRRHDSVLYTAHRVKKKDLMSLTNYNRYRMGKKLIKSATAAYNRARPRCKRSKQASRHLGRGLFCFKKPPKTESKGTILTHHQRKHVKLAKEHLWMDSACSGFALEISMDDKPYLRPGTSIGMSGTKQPKILQPSCSTDARQLPVHDFSEPKLHITPSAFRFMTRTVEKVEEENVLVLDEDHTCFVSRPKAYVGSSGSVWASDLLKLRCEKPDLFEIGNQVDYPVCVRKLCAKVSLSTMYFVDTTEHDDVMCVTGEETCLFREYEQEKLNVLQHYLDEAWTEWEVREKDNLLNDKTSTLTKRVEECLKELLEIAKSTQNNLVTKVYGDELWDSVLNLLGVCNKIMDTLQGLPTVKPRILSLTDAGPGVGVSNHEVQFRSAEVARLFNLDWEARIHRATDDPCEAERSNAAAGDALVDGGPLPVPSLDPFAGLSSEEVESLNEADVNFLKEKVMQTTAWQLAREVAFRIDDAPGPHGYMSAFTTGKPEESFFWNKSYLLKFITTSQTKRNQVPGHTYFNKIEEFKNDHQTRGELYLEHRKFSCQDRKGSICDFCGVSNWVGPKIGECPRPYPDETKLPEFHYKSYSETPVIIDGVSRPVDDMQPRFQLKEAYKEECISLNNQDRIHEFSDKYIVPEDMIVSYLRHIELIELKKMRRKRVQSEKKNTSKAMAYSQYDWNSLFKENKLSGLKIGDLDKYIDEHQLVKTKKYLKKSDKVSLVQTHIGRKIYQNEAGPSTEYSDSDSESDSGDDVIYAAVGSESDSDESDVETGDTALNMLSCTRSGRRVKKNPRYFSL